MADEFYDDDPFHQGSTSPEQVKIIKKKKKKSEEESEDRGFMKREVNLMDSVFFPDGFEHIMLAIYFLTIPYIAGLLFIFFYIGKGDYTIFLTLNDENSFIITWAIGYEVVAFFLLLWITKLGISSLLVKEEDTRSRKFRIP
ncbi:MAG: hypothetical protein U9R27_09800 [Campylobacterota bacterium]|nr:hypothetical protein [Campylobacterota bacterium]